ncbi:MAG: AMP-binding protein [Proteobacteria bacterium]|nr:AMP-binding protein [Pseudomonadota bacterium]
MTAPPFPTVVHMLAAAAAAAPERDALRCGDESLSYRDYAACVAGFADKLAAAIGPDVAQSRIAVVMANSVDTAIAIYAVAATGAQLVPLNPAYTTHELEPILSDADPALIVFDDTLGGMLRELAARIGIERVIAVGTGKRLTVWRGSGRAIETFPDPDSLGLLQYTGGTTGRSKGVNLTHRAVATNVAQRDALLPSEDSERILAVTPLYHSYAMAMGLHLASHCRGTLVLLPRYHPKDVLDLIARERITLFAGSPTLFTGLMGHADFAATDFSSLTLCFSGASALPVETLRRWEEATGCGICEGYGQTEAGPVLTYNPRHGLRKAGSVGTVLPWTEVQIVDVETGTNVLPVGVTGEVRARGPQIMSGYRNRPEETAAALRDRWLYTGDIGAFDSDGYLFIRDRKKDMAIVGGFNVYPREIEEVLCAHPEVIEAAVIGVGDAYRGEALHAYVTLKQAATADADGLLAYLKERLTKYKIPARIVTTAAIPKTGVGKIDKVALRAAASTA